MIYSAIRRRTHLLLVLLLPALSALLLTSCRPEPVSPDPPAHWRFAIEEPVGSVQHAYAMKFKEQIEKRTQGQVKVTVYPFGTLGTSDQLTEQLDLGIVEFVMASPGNLGQTIPEVQLLLLHFVFSDDARVNQRVLEDPELLDAFDEIYGRKGMKLLSIFTEGWQVWTTQRPIRQPADFRSVKMRVMTSPLLLAAYEAYGASPTPLPYSEVYSALQLNMIDGQENPIFAIQEMSFHEVTDWMIFANPAPFVATAVTNQAFFEGLSSEWQEMVLDVVAELNDYIFDVQKEFNAERLQIIKNDRPDLNIIEELTPEEREMFRQASLPVRDLYVEMVGPQGETLLNRLLEAVADAEAASDAEAGK